MQWREFMLCYGGSLIGAEKELWFLSKDVVTFYGGRL